MTRVTRYKDVMAFLVVLGLGVSTAWTQNVVTQSPHKTYIVFEAELGTQSNTNATDFWLTVSDPNASGGEYVRADGANSGVSGSGDGLITYTLLFSNAPHTAVFRQYIRYNARDVDGNGSLNNNIAFHDNPEFNGLPNSTRNLNGSSSHTNLLWVTTGRFYTSSVPALVTYTVSSRHYGLGFDTFVLSQDFDLSAAELDAIAAAGNPLIPEPSTVLLGCLGLVALIRKPRR